MVETKGIEPSTLRMRTHSGTQFVALPSCFQPFRLESEWSCVLLYPLFPCVPETSVVSIVVKSKPRRSIRRGLTGICGVIITLSAEFVNGFLRQTNARHEMP